MSFLLDFITRTAQDCDAWGVPYHDQELQACGRAFNRLRTVFGPAQARLLFDELVTDALNRISAQHQQSPWVLVAVELDFERAVAQQGNRRRVAVAALERAGRLDDDALDLFNDRIHRCVPFPTD